MARFCFVLLLCVLTSGAALGQAGAVGEEPAPEVRYRAKTFIEIGEQRIDGKTQGPSGVRVQSRGKKKFRNLIVFRTHFRREMLRTANDL